MSRQNKSVKIVVNVTKTVVMSLVVVVFLSSLCCIQNFGVSLANCEVQMSLQPQIQLPTTNNNKQQTLEDKQLPQALPLKNNNNNSSLPHQQQQQQQQLQDKSQKSLRPQQANARLAQHMHYKTQYACEGNSLDLSCGDRKLIHLVRANYGRFSLSICNDAGHNNLTVNCASFRAFLIMESRCNNLNNCSVLVSRDVFGDPCEGSSKYLEVQYFCHEDVGQSKDQDDFHIQPPNNRPAILALPPSLLATPAPPQASVSSSQPALSSSFLQINQAQSSDNSQTTSPFIHQAHDFGVSQGNSLQAHTTRMASFENNYNSQDTQDSIVASVNMCPPKVTSHGLKWNATRRGHLASQLCPSGTIGLARWRCLANSVDSLSGDSSLPGAATDSGELGGWAWPGPDTSECASTWLSQLSKERLSSLLRPLITIQSKQLTNNNADDNEFTSYSDIDSKLRMDAEKIGASLSQLLSELAIVVRTRVLFAADLRSTLSMLSTISNTLPELTSRLALGAQFNELVLRQAIEIVSSLLDSSQVFAWQELNSPVERKFALLKVQEIARELAFQYAKQVSSTSEQQNTNHLANKSLLVSYDNAIANILVIPATNSANNEANFFVETSPEFLQIFPSQQTTQPMTTLKVGVPFSSLNVAVSKQTISEMQISKFVLVAFKLNSAILQTTTANLAQQQQQQQQQPQLPSIVAGLFPVTNSQTTQILHNSQINVTFGKQQQQQQLQLSLQQPQQFNQRHCVVAVPPLGTKTLCASSGIDQLSGAQICKCSRFGYISLMTDSEYNSDSDTADNSILSSDANHFLNQEQRKINQYPSVQQQTNRSNAPVASWLLAFALLIGIMFVLAAALLLKASLRASASKSALNKKTQVIKAKLNNEHTTSGSPNSGNALMGVIDPLIGSPTAAASIVSLDYHSNDYKLHSNANGNIGGGTQLYAAGLAHHHDQPTPLFSYNTESRQTASRRRGPASSLLAMLATSLRALKGKTNNHNSSDASSASLRHSIVGSTCTYGKAQSQSLYSQAASNLPMTGQNQLIANNLSRQAFHHHHHHHHQPVPQNQPPQLGHQTTNYQHHHQAASSTSNSSNSYISSSAYYEEIGPGNLTKINFNHHQNNGQPNNQMQAGNNMMTVNHRLVNAPQTQTLHKQSGMNPYLNQANATTLTGQADQQHLPAPRDHQHQANQIMAHQHMRTMQHQNKFQHHYDCP